MKFAPLLLNFLLMMIMPILLGWIIVRRRHVSWALFGIGAITFILAQVLHVPFNYLVTNQLLDQLAMASTSIRLVVTAVFLGLSAALLEEGARYLTFRWWAKDARTWGKGMMLGAGHGGAESILLGALGALNATILLGYRAGYFQGVIPGESAALVNEAIDQLAAMPWFEMMLGALERVFALCIQMALSVMVLQVFARGRLRWLFVAFGWHALIDAVAVLAVGLGGIYVTEALVGLAALISLVIIVRLREPGPKAEPLLPLAVRPATKPIHIEPTDEKLEDSRYI